MKKVVVEAHEYNTNFMSYITGIPENLSSQVNSSLKNVENYDFNVFELDRIIQKKTLYCVLTYILNKFEFIKELLVESKYVNFVNEIISGYNRNVVYHNDLHAADVLQTTYVLITKGNLISVNTDLLNF